MRANHKTGRQSEGKMSGIWEKIKERLGFGKRAEGDKEDDRVMYIIAGLGNPTREYEKTRHNVGFEVIDVLADRLGTTVEEKKFKGCYGRGIIGGQKVLLLKPQTFMNLSGKAVGAMATFFRINPDEILVAHDELDLPPGVAKFKLGGGHGGHNGLKDIISKLGNNPNFHRLRVGIGHPGDKNKVVGFVLGKPPASEQKLIDEAVDEAVRCTEVWMKDGLTKATNRLHAFKAQ